MNQKRPTYFMMCHINKNSLDKFDMKELMNIFIDRNEWRIKNFK